MNSITGILFVVVIVVTVVLYRHGYREGVLGVKRHPPTFYLIQNIFSRRHPYFYSTPFYLYTKYISRHHYYFNSIPLLPETKYFLKT